MHIILITIAFPPRNSPGAQRPYSWAKYWSRAGHRVVVLTTYKSENYNDRMSWQENYEVITAKTPQLNFLGISTHNKGPVNCANGRINKTYKNIKNNIKMLISSKLGHLLDPDLPYLPALLRAGRRCIDKMNCDVMISTFNPGTSHWVARRLKKEFNIPWIADFRDLWSPPTKEHTPLQRLNKFLEKKAIAGADLLLTVSEPLRQILQSRYNVPVVTIANGFDPEEFSLLPSERLFPPDGKRRFVYTGAIYGKRNPRPLFAAFKQLITAGVLAPQDLEILFYGRSLESASIAAQEFGLEQQVRLMGLVDRSTALRAQRDADALILLEGSDETSEGVLTSKIFEYFMASKPILGIGITAQTTLGKLLIESGVGFPLGGSIEAIKSFIHLYLIDNKSTNLQPNWPFINQYSRKTLADKTLSYLYELVHHHNDRISYLRG